MIKPASTALLVIDMQEFFRSMSNNIIPKIKSLVEISLTNKLPVIFTQHGHTESELSGATPNQLVRRWGATESIAQNSAEWEILPELKSYITKSLTSGEGPVAKNTYDAFINSNLEEILKENKVESVIITGVMTNCCVETTARSAFNRGFTTYLVEDACATATKRMHEASVENFRFAFGDVVKTEEVKQMIEGTKSK